MKHVKLSTSTIQRMATLFILLIIMVVLSCVSDKYLNVRNLMNIVRQESTLIIIASAATILMISGGMDLSPAGVIALTSVVLAKPLMAQQTDTLYRINPNNGRSMPLDARHALALFPIWEAFLGTMCGIHATIVAHSIVPLVLIPLSYLIYYEIAKLLFSDKKALLPLFLIFMAVWQMFGNVSIYTTETFFLTRTWQGKSFAGNFVIPAVIWLFLCLFPDKREGEKTPMWKNWIILGALNLAAGASSSLAVLLSCLMTVGFGVLFAIKERKLRNLIYACISCFFGGVYV